LKLRVPDELSVVPELLKVRPVPPTVVVPAPADF